MPVLIFFQFIQVLWIVCIMNFQVEVIFLDFVIQLMVIFLDFLIQVLRYYILYSNIPKYNKKAEKIELLYR